MSAIAVGTPAAPLPASPHAPLHPLRRFAPVLQMYRAPLMTTAYLLSIAAASYLAFWLRFEGDIPAEQLGLWWRTLPWLTALSGLALLSFGLHRAVWRFAGVVDFRDLVCAVGASWLSFAIVVSWGLGIDGYPRSVHIIGLLLSLSFVGGIRLVRRMIDEGFSRHGGKKVLVIGAGCAGEMVVRDLLRNRYHPIGFIDDDPLKLGQWIHRVRVLGSREDLPRIITTESPDEVLVAMPSAGLSAVRQVVTALQPFKIPITTLPPLREILDGTVTVSQVRQLRLEDLLPRAPVQLDIDRARALVRGRRVLVTGAGGSIGSELARQIDALEPERLVLYERYENNLYTVLNTLPADTRALPTLGDITDTRRLHAVLREHRPHLIFHAAAHKHVPLMELNPCEAIKNNVIGTRLVAEAALRYGVEKFVLVSTDKAVNPSSLMGATKRVAELVVQSMAGHVATQWVTVRFGNVLGSNGSVIPRWMEQIAHGGPVTVTHPEVRRFFMLIPEAVQLILQSAAITRGGDIFALEMGEQIPLLEMARNLIRLSGHVPDDEIAIAFSGLRPGEKLSEELVGEDERVESMPSEQIVRLRPLVGRDPDEIRQTVTRLGMSAVQGDVAAALSLLCGLVPTFKPDAGLRARMLRPTRTRGARPARQTTRVRPAAARRLEPAVLVGS